MFNKILTRAFVLAVIANVFMYANMAKAQAVTEGIVSYWTFDRADITDETAKDLWGNNDGTIVGDPKIVEGQIGEALSFDGVDDYVDCGNDASLDTISELTIEAWIKIDNPTATNEIVTKRLSDGTVTYDFMVYHGGNNANWEKLALYTGTSVFSNSLIPINKWQHVVVTNNGAYTTFYIDGVGDGGGAQTLGASNIAPVRKGG